MDGLILAAGFGTRMGCRPKAFLPIGGRSALDHAAAALKAAGCARVLVVHNARWAASFDRWRLGQVQNGVRLEALNDGALDPDGRVGAVGDLRLGLEALGAGEVLLLAVDTVFTWPIRTFLDRAAAYADPVIALRSMRRGYESLGRVDIDPFCLIQNFYEGARPGGNRPWARSVWLGPARLTPDVGTHAAEYCAEVKAKGSVPDRLGDFLTWLMRRRPIRGVVVDEGDAWDVGTPCGLAEAQGALGP